MKTIPIACAIGAAALLMLGGCGDSGDNVKISRPSPTPPAQTATQLSANTGTGTGTAAVSTGTGVAASTGTGTGTGIDTKDAAGRKTYGDGKHSVAIPENWKETQPSIPFAAL